MKKIIFGFSILLLMICLVIISLVNNNTSFLVTTIPKSYSFVSTYYDSDNLEVLLYISDKNNPLVNKDLIDNCYITDNENFNSLKIDLIEINDLNYSEKIKNDKYYLFSFVFNIKQFVLEEFELSINNAILSIETNDQNYNINLGSFYYYKLPYYGDKYQNISISKLVPVLAEINGNKTLGAINIKISNLINKDIEIIEVKLLDNNVFPSNEDILITKEEINNQLSLSSILGYNYEILADIYYGFDDLSIKISRNEAIECVIPLKYLNSYSINSLGFILKYRIIGNDNKEVFSFYYDDFIYFTSSDLIINEDELIINRYEKN